MHRVDRRTGIEILDRDTCLERLRADVIGRLGIAPHGTPLVLPVNYAMDGDHVVFRTGAGSKLSAAERGPACFEIDGFDRENHAGWSVLVQGRLEEVTEHQHRELTRLRTVGVSPWIPEGRDHWMRLVPSSITGRCVRPADAE
jgi:nitroimidazol reductase NimA-like FMN-containing flavoprotein (pyridoxamine 5'-phosphate oxidase superfamily)